MSIAIRPGTPDDARGIARVHVESWRTTYHETLPEDFLQNLSADERAERWSRSLAAPRPGRFTLVAIEESGMIVGFADCGPERGEENLYDGEIYALYLLREYQGMGIGRRLVRASVERMISQGMNSMLIWVLHDNPARKFYEALGGVPVDEKTITVGGVNLVDVGYGWKKLIEHG